MGIGLMLGGKNQYREVKWSFSTKLLKTLKCMGASALLHCLKDVNECYILSLWRNSNLTGDIRHVWMRNSVTTD